MREHGISQMPVLERDGGRLAGLVTEVDLLNHLVKGEGGLDAPIDALIESDYATVTPATRIHLLRNIFNDAKMVVRRERRRPSSASSPRSISSSTWPSGAHEARAGATMKTKPSRASRRSPSTPASRPSPIDRRGDDAGLPDLDLRAERARASTRASSTRARRTRRASRSRRTWPRSRAARWGLASRRACAATTTVLHTARRRRSRRRRRRPLRRHASASSTRSSASSASTFTYVDAARRRPRSPRRSARAPSSCWVETPTNPLLQARRHRARSRASARARGVLPRRRQHLHDAVLPAPARARRRPGRALDDQVPERPLRRRRRRGDRPRPRAARRASRSCRTRSAR